MGTCCCGNKPPENFIGTWTDDQYVVLTIDTNGNIIYQKQTEHTNTNFTGPTRFKENKLLFCCCCCCLRGTYNEDEDSEPILIANGAVLKRQSK